MGSPLIYIVSYVCLIIWKSEIKFKAAYETHLHILGLKACLQGNERHLEIQKFRMIIEENITNISLSGITGSSPFICHDLRKEHIGQQKGTLSALRNADTLFRGTIPKSDKFIVKQNHQHTDHMLLVIAAFVIYCKEFCQT